jgi:putative ABC transport system permease protein
MIENIRMALLGLRVNKLRSALTMLGITIGVAAVIVLISLGQALESFVLGQFAGIGTNLVYVFGTIDDFGRPQPLTQNELEALSDPYNVPDAVGVVPAFDISRNFSSTISFGDQQTTSRVTGVTPRYPVILSRSTPIGRFFDDTEVVAGARVAVIGTKVADRLFPESNPVGQSVRIEGVPMQVIGVLDEQGSANFGPGTDLDNVVFIPLTTAQQRFADNRTVSGQRSVSAIVLEARDESTVNAVVQQATQTMREVRGITFRAEDDFTIATQNQLLSTVGNITGLLTVFLAVIASISLIVGGIGIMNIMLVTVTERTREIGLRKAVGARKGDILFQFLTESVVLSLVGGGIGIAIATSLSALVTANVPDLDISVRLSSILLATGISVAIGVFFGSYPANRAAGLNPIDALRYE